MSAAVVFMQLLPPTCLWSLSMYIRGIVDWNVLQQLSYSLLGKCASRLEGPHHVAGTHELQDMPEYVACVSCWIESTRPSLVVSFFAMIS
jgi:hypothetical protein